MLGNLENSISSIFVASLKGTHKCMKNQQLQVKVIETSLEPLACVAEEQENEQYE